MSALRSPAAALGAALALLLCACASAPRHTPVSAGTEAARLANDRCQARYGARPFHPEDYDAVFEAGRWTWGEISRPVDGFSAEVSFGPDGRDPEIQVDRGEDRGNPDGL